MVIGGELSAQLSDPETTSVEIGRYNARWKGQAADMGVRDRFGLSGRILFGFSRLSALGPTGDKTLSQNPCASLRDGNVLRDGAAANADRADRVPLELDRDASSEHNDATVVGMLNSEELSTRLSQHAQPVSRVVEGLSGERFVDRQFNGSRHGSILALEGKQVAVRANDCDRAWDIQGGRLGL